MSRRSTETQENKSSRLSRREFLKLFGGAVIAYLVSESFWFFISKEIAKEVAVRHRIIEYPNLGQGKNKLFVVHFSDMHVSADGEGFIGPSIVQELSQEVTAYLSKKGATAADTIIFDTGDITSKTTVTGFPTELADATATVRALATIPADFKFAVEGNHDVGHPQEAELNRMIESFGFNRIGDVNATSINELQFAHPRFPATVMGLPDYTTRQNDWYASDLAEDFLTSLESRDQSLPTIMGTHTSNSDTWRDGALGKGMKNTLFLHGHTHGGQIGSSFSPAQYAASRYALHRIHYPSQYFRGLSKAENNNLVGVSTGVGHSVVHKIRTAKPEIIIYEIRTS